MNGYIDECCTICSLIITPFATLSLTNQEALMKTERPTPILKNLNLKTKACTRYFKTSYYDVTPWLTGCEEKTKLFCWPCLLFSNERNNIWTSSGFNDLNNLFKCKRKHETSLSHLKAMISFKTFGSVPNAQATLCDSIRNETVKKNRKILERLIMITCHLGTHELPFRNDNSSNKGNYVDTVHLLSNYDELLSCHLNSANLLLGLSNHIQNDLITSVGNVLLNYIKNEIKSAEFVAVSFDEITDCRNVSQLSAVLRYCLNGKVHERFIEFVDINHDETPWALAEYLFQILEKFDCKHKLIAQTYDAAVTIEFLLWILQKVKQQCADALFIHSYSHKLNCILFQAFGKSKIKECKIFFKTISGLASLFNNCIERSNKLENELKQRFPTVSSMRWTCNGHIIEILFKYRQDLIIMFEMILENPDKWDTETFNVSRGFLTYLNDFDCCFLLSVFSDIFPLTDFLQTTLQRRMNDINHCLLKLNEFQETLTRKRDQFEHYWDKTNEMSTYIPPKKCVKIENDLYDPKSKYMNLFVEIFDFLFLQIDKRFKDLPTLEFLGLINPKMSHIYCTTFPEEAFKHLKLVYEKYFNFVRLRNELIGVYNSCELRSKNVNELLEYLYTTDLSSTFPQVVLLCTLILTIPIPSSNEDTNNSISAVNRIKNYARNSTGEEPQSKLALMSIEKCLLNDMLNNDKKTFIKNVIEDFGDKERKIDFIIT